MKKRIKIAVGGALVIFAAVVPSHAQYLVQILNVNLSGFDTAGNRTIRVGTKELIQYLTGKSLPGGRLCLVTPISNTPGLTDNLNAFLRITDGTTTVLEIPSPDEFNIFQDTVVLRTNSTTISAHAINRFSFDSGSVRAELQGISTWNIARGPVDGVDTSGTGSFQCSLNGWIVIYNVTQPLPGVPISGTISASRPKPGP